tara:strand:+ start:190 stop:336 length:147 start_codon:yes stop_codon:yes gene_type:complete
MVGVVELGTLTIALLVVALVVVDMVVMLVHQLPVMVILVVRVQIFPLA